jgi:polyisoprenoid-binding protein YceI
MSGSSTSRRTKGVIAGAVVLVLLAVGGALLWYFSRDNPDEVSLESATEAARQEGSEDATTTTAADGDAEGGGGDVDGTWVVDTSTGSFDFESATGSFVGFRIEETLAAIGSTEAVGRTGDVTGTITIADDTLESAEVVVDMTGITTNESRRDNRVQQALETSQFPTATFVLTDPVDLGDDPARGDFSGTAKGELTIHGVTRPAEFALEGTLVDGRLVVVGSTEVTFSDYGVEVPSAPVVLSVADTGTVELQLLFTPG